MDVVDKIAKLLALAESPNENEAKQALLKARELMAEHKLSPEQIQQKDKTEVVELLSGITCTKTINRWAVPLACVIARYYCCKCYRNHIKGAKTVEIGFIGFKEDTEICAGIFKYAYNCALARCEEIRKQYKGDYRPATTRDMANSYGDGFVSGLRTSFQKQAAQKTVEWGLVMVTPKAVQDAADAMGKPSLYGHPCQGPLANQFKLLGYVDGQEFNPSQDLSEGTQV